MPDVFYVGSENELRQIKITKWAWSTASSLSPVIHKMNYDERLAMTHPRFSQLGIDLLYVAADHEDGNTAEPEIVTGPTVAGSKQWKALIQAQKILTAVFANSGLMMGEEANPACLRAKKCLAWTSVLAEYNKQLRAAANKPGAAKTELLACVLYTLTEISALVNSVAVSDDPGDVAALFDGDPDAQQRSWQKHVEKVSDDNGSRTAGEYFLSPPKNALKSGTQCSFEVPLSRIGGKTVGLKQGLELAFTKPPAGPSKPMNIANYFAFARDTASDWVDSTLSALVDRGGTPTAIAEKHQLTDDDVACICSVFTIFCFNRMISLSDGKQMLSGEKDKYGLLFKVPPDDLIRCALTRHARTALLDVHTLPDRNTRVDNLLRALVQKLPSTCNIGPVQTASLVAELRAYTLRHMFPASANSRRYKDETDASYGTAVERYELPAADIATGKPLAPRALASGTIAVVIECRDSDNPFSILVATNPGASSSAGPEELARLQQYQKE